jgi:NADH dehydrogenase
VILVTGGTGFVGPKVVHALRAQEREVRCLVRKPGRAGTLKAWGCEVVQGDVTDAESMRRAAEGCEAVVHLVAIITGSPADFDRVMTGGTQNALAAARPQACADSDDSALGVSDRRERSFRTGGEVGDGGAVRDSGIEHVVFRPASSSAATGGITPLFVRQVRWSPVTPVLGSGERRLNLGRGRRGTRGRSTPLRRRTGHSGPSAPIGLPGTSCATDRHTLGKRRGHSRARPARPHGRRSDRAPATRAARP